MIRQLLALSDPRGRRLLIRTICWIVLAAIVQGVAFLTLVPFLDALFSGEMAAAARAFAWLSGLALVYALAFWLSSQDGTAAATEILTSLLTTMGDRIVELPLGWFDTDRTGQLSDAGSRGVAFASCAPYAILRPILMSFITPATVLAGTFFIDLRIAAVMTATIPLMWLVHRWYIERYAAADVENALTVAESSSRIIEFARVQPAVRAAGDNAIARDLVDNALREQRHATRRSHLTGGSGLAIFGSVVQLAVVAVIALGTWLALGGELPLATLIALLVLTVRFTEPIAHAGALGGGISVATNTLDQITALIEEETLPEPAASCEPKDHTVRFEHVTFGYGAAPVLCDLSFTAPAGAMTAIVGPSGSGKTTIIKLVGRFYDPGSGAVSLGGVPLSELGSKKVLAEVAPVFQEVYLFDGTILENIWLGRPDASRAEVIAAGNQARVDEIVERLAGGWDARVGGGGTTLSGGERQRVAIARALLKDAPVVLLDEATASLDVDNEQAILDSLDAIRDGRTLIVVAHRLSTIASADHIVMLDATGVIAEQGKHEDLVAAGGDYARYWNERVRATGWHITRAAT